MKNLLASPLFTVACATLAFILLVWGSHYDTSVPDVIATEAMHNAWVAEHGTDQTLYHTFLAFSAVLGLFSILSYRHQKTF